MYDLNEYHLNMIVLDQSDSLICLSVTMEVDCSRILAPLEALFIIGWWAADLIDGDTGDGEKWYEFGRETLVITVVQVL